MESSFTCFCCVTDFFCVAEHGSDSEEEERAARARENKWKKRCMEYQFHCHSSHVCFTLFGSVFVPDSSVKTDANQTSCEMWRKSEMDEWKRSNIK